MEAYYHCDNKTQQRYIWKYQFIINFVILCQIQINYTK